MNLSIWLKRLFLSLVLVSGLVSADVPATVNINTADATTLAEVLTGIGEVRAQEIVKWRDAHGNFTSIEQLAEVKGVGARVIEKNRERIVLQ
ncbi:ComEA family DNA-binding protein [Litorivivens sp.]|uniref:ComEA family DNA-binding protein n=1 Tax=Litorivivens sp. TaxID=2020868 RepID=UPI0035649280